MVEDDLNPMKQEMKSIREKVNIYALKEESKIIEFLER